MSSHLIGVGIRRVVHLLVDRPLLFERIDFGTPRTAMDVPFVIAKLTDELLSLTYVDSGVSSRTITEARELTTRDRWSVLCLAAWEVLLG